MPWKRIISLSCDAMPYLWLVDENRGRSTVSGSALIPRARSSTRDGKVTAEAALIAGRHGLDGD
jgi:hypothetical protein